MGKRTKLREAQKRAAEQALAARLCAHSRLRRRYKVRDKAFIASYSEFPPEFRARIKPYERYGLRPPEEWRCHPSALCAEALSGVRQVQLCSLPSRAAFGERLVA